jgi:hypothetical protein
MGNPEKWVPTPPRSKSIPYTALLNDYGVKKTSVWESAQCAAEGATAPESLRQKDQADFKRWKERVTPPPTGKAFTGEALRQQGQRGSTILETP